MLRKKIVPYFTLFALFFGVCYSQPEAPTTEDAACEPEPVAAETEYAFGLPDSAGFRKIFNGVDFTGWWQNCQTVHSSNSENGAVMRVSPEEKAIYMTQRGTVGGVLMSRRKYLHYEIIFDFWTDFGNDVGFYNRTTADGACYVTTLDYLNGGSLGGAWGEGSFGSFYLAPFLYYGNENTINLNAAWGNSWTQITSALNPSSYGCADTGCVEADYNRLWDSDGWNQIRIQFYGAHIAGSSVRMKSWFRKIGDTIWVPILQDTTLQHKPVMEGYIGFQQHGGGNFSAPKGTWYRNIKLREFEANGTPIIPGCREPGSINFNPHATVDFPGSCEELSFKGKKFPQPGDGVIFNKGLSVTLENLLDPTLYLLDTQGNIVDKKKTTSSGRFNFDTKKLPSGIYFLQVKTENKTFVKKYIWKPLSK